MNDIETAARQLVDALEIRTVDGHLIGLRGGTGIYSEWRTLKDAITPTAKEPTPRVKATRPPPATPCTRLHFDYPCGTCIDRQMA